MYLQIMSIEIKEISKIVIFVKYPILSKCQLEKT